MRRPLLVRAYFLTAFACTATVVSLLGQETAVRPSPRYLQDNRDEAEGARALAQFRRAGLAGDYWLEFELRTMPRTGAERTDRGQLYGTQRPEGPWSRLVLPGTGGVATEQRWLFVAGRPEAWHSSAGAVARALDPGETFGAIAGTGITLFDLQMPFLHWRDTVYEGLAKVRGRPAHRYLLHSPPELRATHPELAAVRIAIDGQFLAMVQAELLDATGKVLKTIAVLEVKKLGEQWIVKSVDVRNPRTRDKTRFTVVAAALDQKWPPALLEPAGLGEENPPVPAGAVQRF